MTTPANLCPVGLAGWRAAMEEAAGLAQGAHVRALTRPDHAEEILHHLVQRLLDRMSFADTLQEHGDIVATLVYSGCYFTLSPLKAAEHEKLILDFGTPRPPQKGEALAAAQAEAAQEGLADAVAHAAVPAPPAPPTKRRAHPNQLHAAPKWTPARLALVHEKAGKILGRDLLKLLNALPGPPIASTGAMRVKLRDLGLAATPGLPPLPADFDPRDMDEAARDALRERSRLLAVAAGMGDWTEARLALVHTDYATAPTLPELLTRINGLPGNPIASMESMRRKAETLGLRRPNPGASPEHMARMNAARSAQAAQRRAAQQAAPPPAVEPWRDHFPDATKMVPTPEAALDTPATIKPALNVPPAAPPRSTQRVTTPWIKEAMEGKRPIAPVAATLDAWASPGVLTPEAEADAQRMLAEGQGAKAMHEEFGGRLEWWQSWTARHRQAGRAA